MSPLESWVARLPKVMPLRSYGEVGGLRRVLRFEPGYSMLEVVGLEAVGLGAHVLVGAASSREL